MTISQEFDQFAAIAPAPAPEALNLPLVSVVVVNYNYGRYLEQAVESVFAQTYRQIECIIVDNASTDNSAEVIAALMARHPKLAVLRRASNDGQTAASLDGLAATSGPYVIFLDADDFLLPHAVDLHVLTHLSARRHIGFTSGDMLQVQNDQVVLGTGSNLNNFIDSAKDRRTAPVRRFKHPDGSWPDAAVAARLNGRLHYAPPLTIRWIWSPTSGMCFRRDALVLFADNPDLPQLRANTDLYFAIGIGGLSGSILIDEPIFGYRIHGSNVFSRGPQLDNFLVFQANGANNYNDRAQRMLIDHLVRQPERFAPASSQHYIYFRLLKRLDMHDDAPGLPWWARRSRAAWALVQNFAEVSRVVGVKRVRHLLIFVFHVPPWTVMRLKS